MTSHESLSNDNTSVQSSDGQNCLKEKHTMNSTRSESIYMRSESIYMRSEYIHEVGINIHEVGINIREVGINIHM